MRNYTFGFVLNFVLLRNKLKLCFPKVNCLCELTLKVLANEDTLLRTHCCGHIVADTNVFPFARARNICCGHKFCVRDTKMFLILFRNILCPQEMFPSLRSPRNIMSNNVSATMCPRLAVSLNHSTTCQLRVLKFSQSSN